TTKFIAVVAAAAPSMTAGSEIASDGGGGAGAPPSSSTIVPVPLPSATVRPAPAGEVSTTENVSLGSTVPSPMTGIVTFLTWSPMCVTWMLWVVTPGPNVSTVAGMAG